MKKYLFVLLLIIYSVVSFAQFSAEVKVDKKDLLIQKQ